MLSLALAASPAPTASASEQMAGDAERGRLKASLCSGCHGVDGNSAVTSWPKLASQRDVYIVKQLTDFKQGLRADPMMSGVSAGLSTQDMWDIAAWYSSQPLQTSVGGGTGVELGRQLYFEGRLEVGQPPCAVCHSTDGEGATGLGWGGFPALRSQHAPYLVKALRDFQTDTRTNDQGRMMSHIAKKLTQEEIMSLAAFLETMEPAP